MRTRRSSRSPIMASSQISSPPSPNWKRHCKIMSISKIGVIGAGLMGNGIAHAAMASGFDVILVDSFPDVLPKALATITKNMDRQVAKGSLTAEAKEAAL